MKILQYIVILFFLITPFSVRAALSVNTFSPELVWTNSCQLTIEYFLEVEPTSLNSNNSYYIIVTPEINGQLQTSESQEYPLTIPGDGVLEDQVINLAVLGSGSVSLVSFGSGDYQIKILETQPAPALNIDHAVNNLTISSCDNNSNTTTTTSTNNNTTTTTTSTNNNTTTTPDVSLTQNSQDVPIDNPISVSSIPELVNRILEIVIRVGIPLLVIMIIYSGALYILARGNTDKLKNAHDALLYTLIGGAILLGAWALAQLIQSTLLDLTAFVSSFFV